MKKSEYKLSVITVNYNHKIGLEKTLKSVVEQTWQNFEFIVIDGNSVDGSKALIQYYSKDINYWVSEPDRGVYHAMNKGILAAHGEFVIFMNSGDVFYNTTVLENIHNHLLQEYDIYYGNNYKVKKNGFCRKKTYPEVLTFSFFFSSSLNHQSTFIKRKLFFDHFLYNEEYKIIADWDFFIYVICKQNVPYKYLGQTISKYDFTGMSSLPENKTIISQEKKATLHKYFPLFVEDYNSINVITSKRVKQFLYLQQFGFSWKLLKGLMSLLLLFIPKMKK